MADLDERLNQLLSDQDTMNRILELANLIQSKRDSQNPEPVKTESAAPSQEHDTPTDFSALLASALSAAPLATPTNETASTSGESIPALAAILPQLLQAMSGHGDLLKRERVDLIRAMRPYLKENRLQSIDRALKMANVTKAATSAMHLLGR